METNQHYFDVIIIGGGPAGMMAALSARKHHPEQTVAILDRSFELGRKFLTSGAGRGNLTNVNLEYGPKGFFHGDQEFIASIFSQFGYSDIMHFFDELGVPTYEEKKTSRGKIFPAIDHAKTVRDMFIDALGEQKISMYCNVDISTLELSEKQWKITTKDQVYDASTIIFTAGGKTYPALGADGSGYELLATLGHTIIVPVVTAVPVVSKNMLSHYLQGEKMIMQATSVIDDKDITTAVGDVMFTQYGFSGPAIFDISHDISVHINRDGKSHAEVRLSFFPNCSREEAEREVRQRLDTHGELPVSHSLWGLFTEKASGAICATAQLPKDRVSKDLTKEEWNRLIYVLTEFRSPVTGTRGWNEGEFTAGGVDTDEVDPKTLASKKVNGLYIAGEILNIDGQVGGFNLSWAWATGWIAGTMQ